MRIAVAGLVLLLGLTLAVPTTFAAASGSEAPAELSDSSQALPEPTDVACVLEELETAKLFAPSFLAGAVTRSSCTPCWGSAECQPICGGQVGSDFVCHYDWDCGEGRFCICFE